MKKIKKIITTISTLIIFNIIIFSNINIVYTNKFSHDESEDKNFSFEEIVTRKGYLIIYLFNIYIYQNR